MFYALEDLVPQVARMGCHVFLVPFHMSYLKMHTYSHMNIYIARYIDNVPY